MLRRACLGLILSATAAQADWSGFYTPSRPSFDIGAMSAEADAIASRDAQSSAAPSSPPVAPRAPLAGVPDLPGLTEDLPADLVADQAEPLAAPPAATDSRDADICVSEILEAQRRHAIPGNLLLAIGLQEAGTTREGRRTIWPWTVNAGGQGRMFDAQEEAISWVDRLLESGVDLVDLGCMQVNMRWHGERFESVGAMLDPRGNVDYAARFLVSLKAETGDWASAASAYHSRNTERGEAYLDALIDHVDDARDMAGSAAAGGESRDIAAPAPAIVGKSAPKAIWSAGLGAGSAQGGSYGIYSREEIGSAMQVLELQEGDR